MARKIRRTKKKGAITRSDLNIEKLNAKEVLKVAKKLASDKPVFHLVKNTHTNEYEEHIQYVNKKTRSNC